MTGLNPDHLQVDKAKITDYLLCTAHPDGNSKAAFFAHYGFLVEQWQVFATALRVHGKRQEIVRRIDSPFGAKYLVTGRIDTPDGRDPVIRTVWIQEHGQSSCRLVTAYPYTAERS